ncbi:hypothetical protein DSO57_1007580 [Entomophthora muscae]|uniref:Uncharacterized protein n=1 Tax=Entomophthora muscae TaxID=34485 RepID=A0ACC2S9D4_9FUNG|nr:hypothetical protein DSO57_1007580 [Entomophthora muscae]
MCILWNNATSARWIEAYRGVRWFSFLICSGILILFHSIKSELYRLTGLDQPINRWILSAAFSWAFSARVRNFPDGSFLNSLPEKLCRSPSYSWLEATIAETFQLNMFI